MAYSGPSRNNDAVHVTAVVSLGLKKGATDEKTAASVGTAMAGPIELARKCCQGGAGGGPS